MGCVLTVGRKQGTAKKGTVIKVQEKKVQVNNVLVIKVQEKKVPVKKVHKTAWISKKGTDMYF